MPLFSIIVPTYNRANYIAQTVRCFLDQKMEDFELIVVDDGSTDDTRDVIQQIKDSRLRYFYKENGERAAARNYGADRANGQYLNFFDSDDVPYDFHLSTARDFIQENQYPDWFHVGYKIVDENDRTILEETNFNYDIKKRLIKTNFFGCDSVFLKKEVFADNRFTEDRTLASSEDWELWLRIISRYEVKSCPTVTFQMTNHSERSLFTIAPEKIEQRDLLMTKLLLNDKPFVSTFKKDLSMFMADRYTFFALVYALTKNDRKKSIQYLLKSLQVYPLVICRKRFWASLKHLV